MSSVAGIVKPDGGFRVVVTERKNLKHHVSKGEKIFIVPRMTVKEPIPYGQAQVDVINAATKYMYSQLACGGCKACCKTLFINEDGFLKASNTLCKHAQGVGCGIYKKRPAPCRNFKCNWLKSQGTEQEMPLELRPDKCGVIMTADTAVDGRKFDPDLVELHFYSPPTNAILSYLKDKKTMMVTHYTGEA